MGLRVIHYSSNSDIPESVRATLPDDVAQSIFRAAFNSHVGEGRSEMHGYIKAYRVLEDAGYQWDETEKCWKMAVAKDAPTVGDVHVDTPLGSRNSKGKKPKKKDDPGTQDVAPPGQGGKIALPLVIKADKITVDVPLFLRLLETAREEIKEDEPLHFITEQATALMEGKESLDMSDYAAIMVNVKAEKITKRISGNSPISLNAKGERLADALGKRIALKGGLDILHSSPLPRARQTADAIAKHTPEMKRADPADALRPWRLGSAEGKQPDDVHLLIEHYIENPTEVPPGKGADGKPAEPFEGAKIRQLDYLLDCYTDHEIHPNWKIGVVMHSRGMELLQSWVDAGCPEDYELDQKDLLHPDDPDHATVLRWHGDKVKDVDLEEDDELKPGVYLILHSLTDDDTDEGNKELEKIEKIIREENGSWHVYSHDGSKHLGGPYGTKAEAVDRLKQVEGHKSKAEKPERPPHLRNAGSHTQRCSNCRHFDAKGHCKRYGNYPVEAAQTCDDWEALPPVQKYLPPLEVHRSAKAAYEAGASIIDITAPLAEGEGIYEEEVRKVAEHFAAIESVTDTETARNAWGGPLAGKWALRVLKKIERDRLEEDKLKWHGFDLDGTLAQELEGDYDPTKIGEPVPAMLEKVKEFLKAGELVKIFTARVADDPGDRATEAIQDWTEKHLGVRLPVTCEKDRYMIDLRDDRAVGVIANTGVEKADDEEGEWITINGQHVLIGDDGEFKAGNPLLRDSFPRESTKAELSRKNYVAAKADVQREADRTERTLAKALGAERTANNGAFDLKVGRYGIEVKTMLLTKNSKITMNKEARSRKISEARREKLRMVTVVADKRGGGTTRYYFTRGVGSFRLGRMKPVTLAELKEKLA